MKSIKHLQEKMSDLLRQVEETRNEIKEHYANKKIECACCKKLHTIKKCIAYDTYSYFGLDSDYYEGEMQFVCPKSGVRNRLYFALPDYSHRKDIEYDAEMQFKSRYRDGMFKETIRKDSDEFKDGHINNYYVDKNHKKFDIKIKV